MSLWIRIPGFDGVFSFDIFQPGENCEPLGFEFLNKTECNKVSEIEWGLVYFGKLPTELVDKCMTMIVLYIRHVTYK